MYNNIFINSSGTNIYTTLGTLESIREIISNTIVWNTVGSSSLILFYKCIGYTFRQIFDILTDFDLVNAMVNGSSLLIENQEDKKQYIRKWIIKSVKKNSLFNENTTLEEIYKLINIFPSFIVWDKKLKKIININPVTFPHFTLLDSTLASLCYLGIYDSYEIEGNIFSNLSSIDCYPYLYSYTLNKDRLDTLFVANLCIYENKEKKYDLGPLNEIENEILRQISEHEIYRINNISKTIRSKDFLKIHSFYKRGYLTLEEKETLYKNGIEQGSAFNNHEDTKEKSDKFIDYIGKQS